MRNNISSLIIITIIGSIAIFSSCKKHENNNPTPNPANTVTFSLSGPIEGHTYDHGDTVWMKGTATSVNELHGYELKIKNKTEDSVVFSIDEHMHTTTITIDTFWVNNVPDHSEMEMELIIEKDHSGNTESKKVNFHCHPH